MYYSIQNASLKFVVGESSDYVFLTHFLLAGFMALMSCLAFNLASYYLSIPLCKNYLVRKASIEKVHFLQAS